MGVVAFVLKEADEENVLTEAAEHPSAQDMRLRRFVAIKSLPDDRAARPELRGRGGAEPV
jgi:hypothetical protein